MSEWTYVKDKLPDKMGDYLVLIKWGGGLVETGDMYVGADEEYTGWVFNNNVVAWKENPNEKFYRDLNTGKVLKNK